MKIVLAFASIIWFSFSACNSCPPCTQQGELCIAAPNSGVRADERQSICGKVSNPKATVWVVVHPRDVQAYWVQPASSVSRDGTWEALAYIGRPGNVDVGKHFEIMAVADPKQTLKEGDQLPGWPEGKWKSQVIEVIRE